jgi:hypothetical protein
MRSQSAASIRCKDVSVFTASNYVRTVCASPAVCSTSGGSRSVAVVPASLPRRPASHCRQAALPRPLGDEAQALPVPQERPEIPRSPRAEFSDKSLVVAVRNRNRVQLLVALGRRPDQTTGLRCAELSKAPISARLAQIAIHLLRPMLSRHRRQNAPGWRKFMRLASVAGVSHQRSARTETVADRRSAAHL